MNDHEGMVIIGIFSLAIIAAIQKEWATAGLAISGGLAFLKGVSAPVSKNPNMGDPPPEIPPTMEDLPGK